MKTLLKYITYFLSFFILLLIFLPKENLYYFVVQKLQKENIELLAKNTKENITSLNIANLKIKYNKVEIAKMSNTNFNSFLFFSQVDIKDIVIDSSMNKFIPSNINNIVLTHSIIDPTKIEISSKFLLGSCIGFVDLANRVIKLDLIVSSRFKNKYKYIVKQLKFKNNIKNTKEQRYSYEYKF